jgi:hypothetical protein
MVCFRYVIVNTQHKGDNKDDDGDDGGKYNNNIKAALCLLFPSDDCESASNFISAGSCIGLVRQQFVTVSHIKP